MDWFERLTGIQERSYAETQSAFILQGARLTSLANGRNWSVGEFEMARLADLRRRASRSGGPGGKPTVSILQGNIRDVHASPRFAGAVFQVASQFNALEMVGPDVTPEDGVTRYQFDRTQGRRARWRRRRP